MKRSAVAYVSNGNLILAPIVTTSAGVGLEVDPVRLDDPHDAVGFCAAVVNALEGSRRVVPHPLEDEWKGSFRPFQDAAGVRSLKAFMKNARSASIEASEDHIRITPYRNLGNHTGFEEMPDAAIILPPDDMNRAVGALQDLLFSSGG